MTIMFADNIVYPVITIKGKNDIVTSLADTIAKSERDVMKIQFDKNLVNSNDIYQYFLNPDNTTHTITITDDNGETHTHLDYIIPVKYGEEYFELEENPRIFIILAQLTETDKLLREIVNNTNNNDTEVLNVLLGV